jgi:hypothetical protein
MTKRQVTVPEGGHENRWTSTAMAENYPRNVPNLFVAGRDISVDRSVPGAARVRGTTGMMGEIVGMAASLCKTHNTLQRGVYEKHRDDLKGLFRRGALGPAPAS